VRDFSLHMQMVKYLHGQYPKVHISLHAGELAFGQVPPDVLRFHIRDSIEAGAERIGHGTDIMYENDPIQLLQEMAKKQVLVEISLSSSDGILGIRGDRHPLPVYLHYGVPVALATDDQGVSRSDITGEYLRAVDAYNLSYRELKQMARQSLHHSFLAGPSLWTGPQFTMRNQNVSDSERAQVQLKLEAEFARFEAAF